MWARINYRPITDSVNADTSLTQFLLISDALRKRELFSTKNHRVYHSDESYVSSLQEG